MSNCERRIYRQGWTAGLTIDEDLMRAADLLLEIFLFRLGCFEVILGLL